MTVFRLPAGRINTAVYTSPHATADLDPLPALLAVINGATQTLHVAVYSFTLIPVADALIAAQARGIAITMVADTSQLAGINNQVVRCVAGGIPVHHLGDRYRLQHEKVFLADVGTNSPAVAFGSFNATTSAERSNQEILMVCTGKQVGRVLGPVIRDQIESAYSRGIAV